MKSKLADLTHRGKMANVQGKKRDVVFYGYSRDSRIDRLYRMPSLFYLSKDSRSENEGAFSRREEGEPSQSVL